MYINADLCIELGKGEKTAGEDVNLKDLSEDHHWPIKIHETKAKIRRAGKTVSTRGSTICQLINATAPSGETFAISLNNCSRITKF